MVNIIRGHTELRRIVAAKSLSEQELSKQELSEHYDQADAQNEYAIAQECLLRDRNERAIERINDEAYETIPHEEVAATSRDHKTATAGSEESESSCERDVTRNDPDCLRHDKRSANARHPSVRATTRTGTGSAERAAEEKETVTRKVRRIDTRAPLKHRRNVIAGLLSLVDAEHAHDTPANVWFKYAGMQPPLQMWLPCVRCRKGGSRTLLVNIQADLSLSVECTNEACDANYKQEHPAPDRDRQTQLAEEGADWLALYRQHAETTEKPWLYVWISKLWVLTHGPGSKTLQRLLHIYGTVRIVSRLSVVATREFINKHGLTAHGVVSHLHDGDPVPVLLQIDLASIAKKEHLSEKHLAKYLHMIVKIRLLRVATRIEHGQIVYQAGWWFHTSGMPHSRSMWFLKHPKHSQKWERRLRHVSSGQIRF